MSAIQNATDQPSHIASTFINHNYSITIRQNSTLTQQSSTKSFSQTPPPLNSNSLRASEVEEVVNMVLPDGAIYSGQISKTTGMKHGSGSQTWPDGARYAGSWKQGSACGKGTFYHSNGDVFEGYFRNDKANGKGSYTHVNGQKYEGDWVDDL